MTTTLQQYDEIIDKCRQIFIKKTKDYGTSWRILRTSSLTDQIYIKAQRIRTIQQIEKSKIDEGIEGEFIGITNYCLMALIQLKMGVSSQADELGLKKATELYNEQAKVAKDLMQNKNHDYGEAWRMMRVSSMTDLILTKLLRIKQMEDNDGVTLISEGVDANYLDIINYAIFCLILLSEE